MITGAVFVALTKILENSTISKLSEKETMMRNFLHRAYRVNQNVISLKVNPERYLDGNKFATYEFVM